MLGKISFQEVKNKNYFIDMCPGSYFICCHICKVVWWVDKEDDNTCYNGCSDSDNRIWQEGEVFLEDDSVVTEYMYVGSPASVKGFGCSFCDKEYYNDQAEIECCGGTFCSEKCCDHGHPYCSAS